MMTRSLIAAVAAVLCGCATTYREPPVGAPSASVLFSNVSSPGMVEFFAHADSERSTDAIFIPPV